MAEEKSSVRRTGVVTSYKKRGYGFLLVHGEEDKNDLFVPHSEVKSDDGRRCTLFQDDEVEFHVVDDGHGRPMAADVTRPGGGAFDSSRRPRRVRRSGGEGDSNLCYNCGGVGHRARICPSPQLLRLGEQQQQGYFAKVDGGGRRGCNSCGEEGHFQRECQSHQIRGGVQYRRVCYTCQQTGHLARDCTRGDRGGAAAAGKKQETRKCFNCQKVGHISENCKQQA